MSGIASGTIQDHELSFAERQGGGRYLSLAKTSGSGTEKSSLFVGALSSQSASVDFMLGGSDAVVDCGASPGYVYFVGDLTPNPTSACLVKNAGTRSNATSEMIVVGVPPTSGSEAKEFLYYLGDEGSSVTVSIDAAASQSGQVETQTTTTLRTYIKVTTNTQGKRVFAYTSPQAIPTSTNDPVRQYYDEVTGYAQDVGIDV